MTQVYVGWQIYHDLAGWCISLYYNFNQYSPTTFTPVEADFIHWIDGRRYHRPTLPLCPTWGQLGEPNLLPNSNGAFRVHGFHGILLDSISPEIWLPNFLLLS